MSKVLTKTKPIVTFLNKQVATCAVLQMKLYNFHWNVKGESFFDLHEKFQELYEENALNLDKIAERILALKGKPIGTMKDMLANSSLKEAAGNESAKEMVQTLVNDFEGICKELTDGIEDSEENKDQPTADLLIDIRESLEKHTWMFNAFLGK